METISSVLNDVRASHALLGEISATEYFAIEAVAFENACAPAVLRRLAGGRNDARGNGDDLVGLERRQSVARLARRDFGDGIFRNRGGGIRERLRPGSAAASRRRPQRRARKWRRSRRS